MAKKTTRAQPSLPVDLVDGIVDQLGPEMGDNKSEIVRNIVYAWLSEHGYLDKIISQKNESEEENGP